MRTVAIGRSHIANYPGAKSTTVTGKALLDDMREMAVFYGAEYHKAQARPRQETLENLFSKAQASLR